MNSAKSLFLLLTSLTASTAAAANIITIVAPNISSDGVGGACYLIPVTPATAGERVGPKVVHTMNSGGTQTTIFENEILAGPVGCNGDSMFFVFGPPGAMSLMQSNIPDRWNTITDPNTSLNLGGASIQIKNILVVMVANNTASFIAQDQNGDTYLLNVLGDGTVGLVSAFGRNFPGLTQACATANGYYGMLRLGGMVNVYGIGSSGVEALLSVANTTGDAQLACSPTDASVAWHDQKTGNLVIAGVSSNAQTSYQAAGKLQALAVDASGVNYGVVETGNVQTVFSFAGGQAMNLNVPSPACGRGCPAYTAAMAISASTLYVAFPPLVSSGLVQR